MAKLTDGDRKVIWSEYMHQISIDHETTGLIKSELRAAVNAIDDWVNDNANLFNSAIPEPAKSSLTAKQKAELLMYIVRRRWEVT